MNKKTLIMLLAIALIIGLAVFTGVKLSNKESKTTNANPIEDSTVTPTSISTPDEETPNPEETATPEPTPTANPNLNKDVTKMSSTQKEEYAKEIAKNAWESLGAVTQVSYKYEYIDEGKYIVSVRDSGTYALIWYKVDINTGSCEEY